MFEEVLGLPAHPLIVHAPVVLVPLLILLAAGYAVLPWLRRAFGWALAGLAVVAPLSVWAARQSGEAFQARLAARDALPAELAQKIVEHSELSEVLLWLTMALGVVSLVLLAVGRALRRGGAARAEWEDADPDDAEHDTSPVRRTGLTLAAVLLAVAVLGLSGATGWYLFQTGHTGSTMVWEGS